MSHVTTIGIDLAKQVLAVGAMDVTGAVVYSKLMKRDNFILGINKGKKSIPGCCGRTLEIQP